MEIKFRGKRIDNGEWVEGWYYKNVDMGWDIIIVYNPNGNDFFEIVFPESVGQFTGLLDKNGKEIYEGDIVQICKQYPTNDLIIKVKLPDFYVFAHNNIDIQDAVVVGNIYDNPELLEAK